ncbi:flippase [Lactobacillus reuteri]|nr:flippase [Limosilactobacillus reuteri]MQB87489.1 flippase [Limosilactobacillus reuteri]
MLNSLQTLLNLIFPLITFPYVSRVLSVSGMGKYNFANSIISYFVLIAGLGISRYAVREGAKIREDKLQFSKFASRIFSINLYSTLISYLLLFITLFFVTSLRNCIEAILIFSIQIFFTTLGMDWLYIIYEEYAYITVRNILFKVISILLLFTFVRQSDDYLKYAAITTFASVGSYLLNFLHSRKICNIKLVWKFNWTPYIIPILTIFGTMVAVTIYVSSDITMLGFLKNNYIVGIYSISAKIYGMVGPMLSATMAVTIPRLAMLMGQGKMSNYKQLFKKLLQTMILIVLPAVVGLMMTSKSIVLIIAGGEYLRSATPLSILSIALFFGTLNTIFVECVLIPAKRERATLITAVIAAITNLLLNFVLIPHYSEVGTAMTTVIAECLSMLMNFYFSRDIIGEIFLAKGFWKENLNIVIGTIAIWLVCILIKSLIYSNIIQLIISIICSCVIYILILYVLRNKLVVGTVNNIYDHIKYYR